MSYNIYLICKAQPLYIWPCAKHVAYGPAKSAPVYVPVPPKPDKVRLVCILLNKIGCTIDFIFLMIFNYCHNNLIIQNL